MFKDLTLGLKLLKYGYKMTLNIVMMLLILGIGVVMEIATKGTSRIGGFYFMLCGLFAYQMIISLDISAMIQTTAMKKKLQVKIPVIVSTLFYLVTFTFLIVERAIMINVNPDNKEQLLFVLFTIVVMMFATFLFSGVCYKFMFVAMILLIIVISSSTVVLQILWNVGLGAAMMNMGLGMIAVLGYVTILLGALIEYAVSSLLYRYPLSDFAFRGIFKDTKL